MDTNLPSELELIQYEKFSSFILIIGYTILFISAQKAEQEIYMEQSGMTVNEDTPSPAELAAISGWTRLLGLIIIASIASTRLRQRQQNIQAGLETGSIIPNINITLGAWIAVIGIYQEAVGTQQRADEAARITIL